MLGVVTGVVDLAFGLEVFLWLSNGRYLRRLSSLPLLLVVASVGESITGEGTGVGFSLRCKGLLSILERPLLRAVRPLELSEVKDSESPLVFSRAASESEFPLVETEDNDLDSLELNEYCDSDS